MRSLVTVVEGFAADNKAQNAAEKRHNKHFLAVIKQDVGVFADENF